MMKLRSRTSGRKAGWRVSTGSFVVLFAYTMFIWWQEALDLLMWLFNMPQGTMFSCIAAIILCGIMVRIVGRFERDKAGFSPLYIVLSLFIFIFFAVKGFGPDQSYDTQNYHLLSQIPGFKDNLHYHVIPGRFQMFGFRLGDRMFYLFRQILGLRMGTLLNALAMMVVYRQMTVFFNMVALKAGSLYETDTANGERSKEKRTGYRILRHLIPVLAFLAVSRLEVIQESGSYMVELLALPYLFEMIFLLLRDTDADRTVRESILFCLFGGILFCLKMTNIVYLLPLVLLYIWKIRKEITPKLFLICLFTGIFPVSIYLLYNGLTMENPIYPYYNSFFCSPYSAKTDFKDVRWGPENFKELLLWAYYMIRYPENRLSEYPDKHNYDLALMYCAVVAVTAIWLYNRYRKCKDGRRTYYTEGKLFLLYAASFILWAATTGHTRYFMGGLLIAGMICGCLVIRILISPARSVGKIIFLILFAMIYVGRTVGVYTFVLNGNEWAMRTVNRDYISKNLPCLFKDHQLFTPEELSKIDYIFLTWSDVGSYARLAGEDVPVWNRYSIVNELSDYKDDYIAEIQQAMEEGKGVYDMFPQGTDTLEGYLEWMNDAGWYVHDMEYQETILKGYQSFTLAGLEMAHGRENRWYYTSNANNDEKYTWKYTGESDYPTVSAIIGDPDYWMFKYPFEVDIVASDGKSTKTAAQITVGEKEYEPVKVQLDLTGLKGDIKLELVSTVDVKRAVLINPEWS